MRCPKLEEDRDERRRQAGLDEHVEQQLGQHEGGVVGVELGAGAERAREDPIAHEPHQVAAEDEDGEERRALGEEAPDEGRTTAGRAHRPGERVAQPAMCERCSASCWRTWCSTQFGAAS